MVKHGNLQEGAGRRKGTGGRDDPTPLCPVWLTFLISAGTGLLLAAVFPGHHVKAKSIAAYSPSALSLAYLEAGLSTEPNSLDHLDSLADHSLKLARWQEGLSFAERMEQLSGDATSLQRALAMELIAAEQLLYDLDTSDPEWPLRIKRFERLLHAARRHTWSVPETGSLAIKALDAGLDSIAAEFYSELVRRDPPNAARWQAKRAQADHSAQKYDSAADAYFAAYRLAPDTLEKRAYFIAALQVLESGDKIAQASSRAHEHIGELIHDRLTVRYVLSLAVRAANANLIRHYAHILRSMPPDHEQRGRETSAAIPYLMLVSSPVVTEGGAALDVAERQEEYDLLFTAFVESGALSDAVEVARDALEQRLDPLIWHPRLARVSQWNNDAPTALKHWMQHALRSNDQEAWDAVLNLAPQLDEDDAYLLAWKARYVSSPFSEGDLRPGLTSLMARYVETAHWESVLRVLNRLEEADAALQQPELLLLRISATEQRAWQVAPDLPQRDALMAEVRVLLSEAASLDQWTNDDLAWLAERARAVGAHTETAHYYRLLAEKDPGQATRWLRSLGDAQLANQNYQAAAESYFSARNTATSIEERREYFQAAINAFVSGDMVERAVDTATKELGDLSDDAPTLRYLINLARQSGKPELVTKFARRLLEVGRLKPDLSHRSGLQGEKSFAATAHHALWRGPAPVRSVAHWDAGDHRQNRQHFVNTTTSSSTEPDDYEIAFRAFLESQALDDAERTAELALANGQSAALWAPRLAQVAQWNNRPDKALTYWRIAARESGDGAAWQAALELARQGDNVAVQIEALVALAKLGRGGLTHVMELAQLQHEIGQNELALRTLRNVRGSVRDGSESARFWRLYGRLARAQGEREDADFAYRRLLASGQSDLGDLQSMAAFYEAHPLDSGRLAELEFRQTGSLPAWQRAMQAYWSAGSTAHIESLLGAVPAEHQAVEGSPDALIARAQYRFSRGQREEGLEDMRRALRLESATDQTRLAYLWGLVDYGQERELREALTRFERLADANPDYLAVFAAGWLRAGESLRAAQYFRRQRLSRGDDPLWLIALASAEESAGNPARAREIRDQAWRLLPPLSAVSKAEPHQAEVARVLLGAHRYNADYARAVLIRLLHEDAQRVAQGRRQLSVLGNIPGLPPLATPSGDVDGVQPPTFSSEARQGALAWALGSEEYRMADAWLASQYADQDAPADARLAVAMGIDDQERVASVLKEPSANLPIDARIQALVRTRDIAPAQTLAYQAAEGAPYNEGRHEVLTGVMRMTGERPSVGADIIFSDTEPLRYTETTLNGFIKLTQRQGVGVQVMDRDQRSTDASVLAWVPSNDREAVVAFSDHTPYRTVVAKVGYRDAWETFLTASLRTEFRPDDKIRMAVELGMNQFTNISQMLQVAASKDRILLSAQWSPDRHWFIDGAAELARFHTQDRTSLGRSTHLVAMAGYRFGGELNDWSLRAFTARGDYSARDRTVDSLQRLVPAGHSLQASAFMPQDFKQYGAFISYGSNDKNPYSSRWRPFLEAGYIHDSNQGWGPTVHAGAGGPIVGKDHLRFFYFYSATPQGGGQRVRQVGLSYRFFF